MRAAGPPPWGRYATHRSLVPRQRLQERKRAFDLLVIWFLILICRPFGRPSGGFAEWVDRHGCRESRVGPWMARHGVPTERDRSEGT